MRIVTCPYCSGSATLADGAAVYPHRRDLTDKKFWVCDPCAAWVGCHPGTDLPLGRLANAELRKAKRRAHDAFDPLWRDRSKNKTTRARLRTEAYASLAKALRIRGADCHIGMFDVAMCVRVVEIAPSLRLTLKGN